MLDMILSETKLATKGVLLKREFSSGQSVWGYLL